MVDLDQPRAGPLQRGHRLAHDRAPGPGRCARRRSRSATPTVLPSTPAPSASRVARRPPPPACADRAATARPSPPARARTSRTERAIGPQWSSVGQSGLIPARLTRPKVGFSPTMPHTDAGQRIEPPVSVPGASATIPAATAAPEPPLEPPGTRVGSCGLRQVPNQGLSQVVPQASSCVFSLAMQTAPARRERRHHVGVAAGHVVAVDGAAVGGADAAGVDQILPADRHARQRARDPRPADGGVHRRRLAQRPLLGDQPDRAQLVGVGPVECSRVSSIAGTCSPADRLRDGRRVSQTRPTGPVGEDHPPGHFSHRRQPVPSGRPPPATMPLTPPPRRTGRPGSGRTRTAVAGPAPGRRRSGPAAARI